MIARIMSASQYSATPVPAMVLIGVGHYAAHCAVCHGAPGVPKGDIGRGLYPPPPDLAKTAALYSPGKNTSRWLCLGAKPRTTLE